ncbi:Fic family protein [Companilactobacillus zhachilii]|uniref:Fic family protein n=1 Tax=Companilactobacillus zhachilii TaxID=2304606 RepID=A0A386PXD8_9LACO|nr:Fic family protein [Companilactobacillus zhachilii]AYE39230.1 Fic family protein [Companilactobacillus zhachilii]
MEMKPLSTLKYMSSTDDSIDVIEEYKKRLSGYSSFQTNLFPILTDKSKKQYDDYPIFFVETRSMVRLNAEIRKNSSLIENIGSSLPGIAKESYTNSLLTNEIQFSNEIEGVKTERREIGTVVDELQNNNKTDKKRLVSTVKKYIDILGEPEIKIENFQKIRDIYDKLTDGEIEEGKLPDGEYFRDKPVRIGTDIETVHRPPVNEKTIKDKLMSLIDFMNNEDIPPVEKSLVTHFMFENTHPFMDGNGRMGRYLLSQYLSKKLDPYTALSISSSIHSNQAKYYKIFKDAELYENKAELTFFIQKMMEIILEGQNSVLEKLNELLDLLNKYFVELKEILNVNDTNNDLEFNLLFVFIESKLFNVDSSLGVKDTPLINMLYKRDTRLYKKVKIREIIKKYEDSGVLVKVGQKPLQHEIDLEKLFGDIY